MKPKPIILRRAGIIIGVAAVCLFFIITGAQFALNRDSVKENIRVRVSGLLQGELTYDQIRIFVFPRPHAKLINPEVLKGKQVNWKVRSLDISFEILPLLSGSFKPHSLALIEPVFNVQARTKKTVNGKKEEPSPDSRLLPIISASLSTFAAYGQQADIHIDNGTLAIKRHGKADLEIKHIFSDIKNKGKRSDFSIECSPGFSDRIIVQGMINPKTATAKGRILLKAFNVQQLPDGISFPGRSYMQSCEADVTIDFETGNLDEFHATFTATLGHLKLKNNDRNATLGNGSVKGRFDGDKDKTRLHIQSLRFDEPGFFISGTLTDNRKQNKGPKGLNLEAAGSDIHIQKVREMVLALAGNKRSVQKTFRIVNGGRIDSAVFTANGNNFFDLFAPGSFSLKTLVSSGLFYIPGIKKNAHEVTGPVKIQNGVLSADGLSGRFDASKVNNSTLRMGLSHLMQPFHLEADVEIDLAEFAPVSLSFFSNPKIKSELQKIDDVNGRAKGRVVLSKKQEGIDLDLYVSHVNLSVDYKRLFAPVTISSGRVLYKNKSIYTDHLSGTIGQSSFTQVKSSVDWSAEPVVSIDSGKADLSVEQVMPWLKRFDNISPVLDPFLAAQGTLIFDKIKIKGMPFKNSEWDFDLAGKPADIKINHSGLPGAVSLATGTFSVKPGVFTFSRTDIGFLDAWVQISGQMTGSVYSHDKVTLKAQGSIGADSAKWVESLVSGTSFVDLKSDADIKDLDFRLWKGHGFDLKGHAVFTNGPDIRVDLFKKNGRLTINTIQIADPHSTAAFSLKNGNGAPACSFKGNIEKQTLDTLLTQGHMVQGSIRGDLKTVGNRSFFDLHSVTGRLEASGIDLNFYKPFPLVIQKLAISGNGENLEIEDAKLSIKKSLMEAKGSVLMGPDHFQVDLDVAADMLSHTTFKTRNDNTPSPTQTGTAKNAFKPVKGNIRLDAGQLDIKAMSFTPFSAHVALDGEKADIRINKAVYCGINVTGTATLSKEDINVSLHPFADKTVFQPVLDCVWDKKIRIDGLFDLDGKMAIIGKKTAPILPNLTGNLTLVSENGRIHHLNLLSKIFAVLNITEIFAGKGVDLAKSGFGYDRADIKTEIADNTLIIKELLIDGQAMKITGSGQVDLLTNTMNIALLVAPLKTVDRITSKIPIVNYLTGGTLLTVPLKIKGQPENPTIIPLSPDAIGKGILNIMERIIKAPIKIVESITE